MIIPLAAGGRLCTSLRRVVLGERFTVKTIISAVYIVGAGAMGAAYGALFHDLDSGSVSFIARGERAERLRRDGVSVNGKLYRFRVLDPEEIRVPADLVLVAVKHHHLEQAIGDMRLAVGPETVIVSVMNGIESEERIGAVFGMDKVLYAVAVGIDAVRKGNLVSYRSRGRILFGEAKNPIPTERVRRVKDLFDRAGIDSEVPYDMVQTLWWKFMINVGINQASAVLGGTYRLFQTSEEARALMEAAMREVIAVSAPLGIDLKEDDLVRWYRVLADLNPNGKTSMLQDVEARKKTEVEMFAGKVIELGRRLDIPTPVNQYLFDRIKEIEACYGSS